MSPQVIEEVEEDDEKSHTKQNMFTKEDAKTENG